MELLGIFSGPVLSSQVFGLTFLICTVLFIIDNWFLTVLVILGCSIGSLALPAALQQALMFGMVIAKRVILTEWKSASPPCFKRWLNYMVSCLLGLGITRYLAIRYYHDILPTITIISRYSDSAIIDIL